MSQDPSPSSVSETIRLLILRVEELEDRVNRLEGNQGSSTYEFVSEAPSEVPVSSYLPVVSTAAQSSQLPVAPIVPPLDRQRRSILECIGRWIRACLDGRRRGLSGRERIPEANRIYLCFRDFVGRLYNPVRVTYTFQQIVPLVKPQGEPGDSIFIGLPSLEDGRLVCEAASVAFPDL